jgi:hypothetical protein
MVYRPPHPGRLLIGALCLGAVGVSLAPLAMVAASAASTVCEGIVLDYGDPSSSSPSPPATQTQGADIAPGSSDLDALTAAGDGYSLNNSGLLCSINTYDGEQNCEATSGTQYYFWSFWEGNPYTNTWTYAEVGPAEHEVSAGQTYVQGWSYQNPGPASPGATQPSVTPAAAFAQACPGVSPVPASSGGSGSGVAGARSSGPTPTSNPTASTTITTTESSAKGTGTTSTTVVKRAGATSHSTSTVPGGPATGSPAVPGTSTTTAVGARQRSRSGQARTERRALAAATRRRSGGSGDPVLPIVLVGAVIALLGGTAWYRWRRRPAEE